MLIIEYFVFTPCVKQTSLFDEDLPVFTDSSDSEQVSNIRLYVTLVCHHMSRHHLGSYAVFLYNLDYKLHGSSAGRHSLCDLMELSANLFTAEYFHMYVTFLFIF